MPTFANLTAYVDTVTAKLTKPRRGVGGAEGVTAADVLSALVDCGYYVSNGLDSITGKANKAGETFTGNVTVPKLSVSVGNGVTAELQLIQAGASNWSVRAVPSSADLGIYDYGASAYRMRINSSGVGYFAGRLHVGTGASLTDQLTPLYVLGNAKVTGDLAVATINIGLGGGLLANNLRIGEFALASNSTGIANLAFGQYTLGNNTTGNQNIGIGSGVLTNNTSGYANVAIGSSAMSLNTTGGANIAIGLYSLGLNTGAGFNVAVGHNTLSAQTSGYGNVAVGYNAGSLLTVGANNIFLGNNSGSSVTTGGKNVIVGNYNGTRIATLSNWMIFADGDANERFCVNPSGSMGIGITTPDARAILDLTSTTQALVLPRMTTTQRDAQSGWPNGSLIYNTTLNVFQGRANGAWSNF